MFGMCAQTTLISNAVSATQWDRIIAQMYSPHTWHTSSSKNNTMWWCRCVHMPCPHHVWSWACWNETWHGQTQPEECTATQLIKSCQRHITTVYTECLRLSQITHVAVDNRNQKLLHLGKMRFSRKCVEWLVIQTYTTFQRLNCFLEGDTGLTSKPGRRIPSPSPNVNINKLEKMATR